MTNELASASAEILERYLGGITHLRMLARTWAVRPRGGSCEAARLGFRAECPCGWLGSRWVDGVAAEWDCDVAGFGWSEPHFVSPMPWGGSYTASCNPFGLRPWPKGDIVSYGYQVLSYSPPP
jgi:hypothetical protein